MIDHKKFYPQKDLIDLKIQKKIWSRISSALPVKSYSAGAKFHTLSFGYGFAFALLLILAVFGSYTMAEKFFQNDQPEYVKINRAYYNAINEFEKTLPQFADLKPASVYVDDLINAKREKLDDINYAIKQFEIENKFEDYTQLKQMKMRNLLAIKLSVLEELIEIEKGEI